MDKYAVQGNCRKTRLPQSKVGSIWKENDFGSINLTQSISWYIAGTRLDWLEYWVFLSVILSPEQWAKQYWW